MFYSYAVYHVLLHGHVCGCECIGCVVACEFACYILCENDTVGVLAHSHHWGGYDCFAPLATHFDSLAIKFCLLSDFRTWLMLQPSYLLLSHTVARPNQLNKSSILECFPVLEELRGHLIELEF